MDPGLIAAITLFVLVFGGGWLAVWWEKYAKETGRAPYEGWTHSRYDIGKGRQVTWHTQYYKDIKNKKVWKIHIDEHGEKTREDLEW